MSFNDDIRLDPSQVRTGTSGGRGPLIVGGGIGGLVLLVVALVLGVDPSSLPTGGSPAGPGSVQAGGGEAYGVDQCRTGSDANRSAECRVVGTVNAVQAFWADELSRYDRRWRPTTTVLYAGSTASACGTASSRVGPFYCPVDQQVYLDTAFFDVLERQYGSSGGPLAQEYVVAHEYGHALQDQLGLLERSQQDLQGAQSGSVRTELMADCLAGVWAHHAASAPDPRTGRPYLRPLTTEDVRDALSAAAAVGDDRIQQAAQGRVDPETWTHGSAAARQRWFLTGYRSGELDQCDTFAVDTVE